MINVKIYPSGTKGNYLGTPVTVVSDDIYQKVRLDDGTYRAISLDEFTPDPYETKFKIGDILVGCKNRIIVKVTDVLSEQYRIAAYDDSAVYKSHLEIDTNFEKIGVSV